VKNAFTLDDDEPVQLEHFCVCLGCGAVYGPQRYFTAADGVARQFDCGRCDPYPGLREAVPVSNVGDFLGAGLRAMARAGASS
jgi:hypothetical protein